MRQPLKITRVLLPVLLLFGSTGCAVGIAKYGRAEVYRENISSYKNDVFTYPASADVATARFIVRRILADSAKYTIVRESGDTLFVREVLHFGSDGIGPAPRRASTDSMKFKDAKAKEKFERESQKRWLKDSTNAVKRLKSQERSCYIVITDSPERDAHLTFGIYRFAKAGSADDNYTATRLRDTLFWKIRDEFLRLGVPLGPQIKNAPSQ